MEILALVSVLPSRKKREHYLPGLYSSVVGRSRHGGGIKRV